MGAAALSMLRASSCDGTSVLVGSSAMAEAKERIPKTAARVAKDFMVMVESGLKEILTVLE